MYESLIPKEYDGKSLLDFVRDMGGKMGFDWDTHTHLASLDNTFIALNYMQRTLVKEGQQVKVFPLPAGG